MQRKEGKPKNRIFTAAVRDVKAADTRIDCQIPLPWLGAELADLEYMATPTGGHVNLVLSACGSGVLVRGTVEVGIRTECMACGAPIDIGVSSDIDTYMLPSDSREAAIHREDMTPEDLDREYFDGDTIVLDEIVRDAFMMEIPMSPACDGGCPEISKALGEETRGVDPRLAPLASIKLSPGSGKET